MSLLYESAVEIVSLLLAEGFDAVFAGGWVRDHILGMDSDDIDIATSATPEELDLLFPGSAAEAAVHGVCSVAHNGFLHEVATYRIDGTYHDGRRPSEVHFTRDRKQDAFRRDFTVNGMFFQPLENRIFDYVSGHEDLNNRLIRFIGEPDERIAEDRLRILRALRFAVKLGFEIEEDTLAALRGSAESIRELAGERIRHEILKTLQYGRGGHFIHIFHQAGSLNVLFPGLPCHESIRAALDGLGQRDSMVQLALLLINIAPETRGRVISGFRFSRDDQRKLAFFLDAAPLMAEGRLTEAEVKLNMLRPDFEGLLHLADTLSLMKDLSFPLKEYEKLYRRIKADPAALRPWITGNHLMEAGLKPGPSFRELLEEWHHRQLNGEFSSREEALLCLRERIGHGKPGH